jgi:hypothetical protein
MMTTTVLDFHRKPRPKEYMESHFMSCSREEDWLVWRCHECSRKVKTNLISDEVVFERQGNFFAHHTYQCYRPSQKEWEDAGLPPMDLDVDLRFGPTGGT